MVRESNNTLEATAWEGCKVQGQCLSTYTTTSGVYVMKKHYRMVLGIVVLTLLALSLQHLAHGIKQVTGTNEMHAWLMAVGIDGALVAVEMAILQGIKSRWTTGILISACVLSAGFNILGFSAHATGMLGQILAVALGIFVPAAVYGITDTITRSKPKATTRKRHQRATVHKLRNII